MSVLRVLWTIVRIPLKIVLGALLLPLLILQCMIEFVGNVVGIVTGFLGAVFVFIGIALIFTGESLSYCMLAIAFGSLFAVLPVVIASLGSAMIGTLQNLIISI